MPPRKRKKQSTEPNPYPLGYFEIRDFGTGEPLLANDLGFYSNAIAYEGGTTLSYEMIRDAFYGVRTNG